MTTSKKVTNRLRRHNRIRAKVSGSESKPRLIVFRSLNNNYAQLIDDKKGTTIVGTSDLKSKDKGTKTERAKNVGLALAKLALEKGIKEVVFDRNGYKYHGRIKALADGAREGGLQF